VYREFEIKRTEFETVVSDLLIGQFDDPVRVVAFNTLEHWVADVAADIAANPDPCGADGSWSEISEQAGPIGPGWFFRTGLFQ
jgi:hypothetical protein